MIARRIFSDLDNTVIFSHRHEIGEKVVVERLNGKDQAFMPKGGYDLLQSVDPKEFVPVTSRTIAQYQRLQFYADGRQPEYALLDNGGILLVNGEIDEEWHRETEEMIFDDMGSVRKIEDLFKDSYVKLQDGMVLFIKTEIPYEKVSYEARSLGLMVFNHLNKIYVCSGKLTKGYAIKRFKNRFPAEYTIAAGDSEVDITMIPEADKAYFSIKLKEKVDILQNVSYMNAVDISERLFER